nr:hypothetical protein [Tanacetum cinerariifolium]
MDHIRNISKSFFITNFPEITTSKDLWVLCQAYRKVVDVFITNRKSKLGKANVARFEQKSASSKFVPRNINEVPRNDNGFQPPSDSYVSAVKGSSAPLLAATLPAIVLDEECLVDRDLDNSVMGEVHHFSSLNNLCVLLYNEGFADVEIMYLCGLWVMIKLGSYKSKLNFMKHLGVASCTDDMFARKRLSIKTNLVHNILDSFKIIIKGKVFMVHAKELFVWSPSFKDVPEVIQYSDVNSFKNAADNNVEDIPDVYVEEESDCDAVSDTFFGDSEEVPVKENENNQSVNDKEVSKDPFDIYEILNRSKVDVNPKSSIPYPPGFTPKKGNETTMFANISQEVQEEHHKSASCGLRVFEEVENSDIYVQSKGKGRRPVRKEGGSILDALDDMIKLGQAMGFTMDGCTNDMEKIIGSNGEHECSQ